LHILGLRQELQLARRDQRLNAARLSPLRRLLQPQKLPLAEQCRKCPRRNKDAVEVLEAGFEEAKIVERDYARQVEGW
jgi:hypothetical protein